MPDSPKYVLLVVDRASQEDLLLWPAIARAVAGVRPIGLAILHEPGEIPDRALEANGFDAGFAAAPPEAWYIVRRALIEENRKVAETLTEEGVSAVPFLGSARNLLRVPVAPWFVETLRTGAVPVVSAVELIGNRPSAVNFGAAVVHMARLLGPGVLVVTLTDLIPAGALDISGCVTVVSRLGSVLAQSFARADE